MAEIEAPGGICHARSELEIDLGEWDSGSQEKLSCPARTLGNDDTGIATLMDALMIATAPEGIS